MHSVETLQLIKITQKYNKMLQYKNISYVKTIATLVNQGKTRQALTLFRQHQDTQSSKLSEFLLSATARACASLAAIAEGKQLHCAAIKHGFVHDVVLMTSLIDVYSKCTRIDEARKVFDEMPVRDVVARNSMISGLFRSGSALEAVRLFEAMPERNVDSWNAVISGLARGSGGRAGLAFFERMRSEGAEVDMLTMVSVLSICADLAALLDGRRTHALVVRHGFELYLPIGNAVVNMYAKCGCVADALSCFENMPIKNVVTWTALIEGYGKQGLGIEALRALEAMEREGVVPNDVTFLGALHACSHAGLVQEGCRIFEAMTRKHFLAPKIEHYTCVVDLLARSGRLKEACSFVAGMPMKPDAKLLTALLSSCCWHRDDLELARSVGERLLESEPQEGGAYMLLSNMYGLVGDLEGVAKVKMLMSNRGIRKETACTWIEIRD